MSVIKLSGIIEDSITDGPGLRTAIFLQGCIHRCPECHNQKTWDIDGGKEYDIDVLVNRIMANPYVDGITISGGEPFCQVDALLELVSKLADHYNDIAIYTGYTIEELFAMNDEKIITILNAVNTLIDGKFINAQKSLKNKFKGSNNQRIIDTKATIAEQKIVLDLSKRWN